MHESLHFFVSWAHAWQVCAQELLGRVPSLGLGEGLAR